MDECLSGNSSGEQCGLSRLLQDAFDTRQGSVGSLLQELLHASRLYLGLEVAFISELRDGRRFFRYVDHHEAAAGLLEVGNSDPLEESYCQKVVQGRLPELIRNAQELGEARKIHATEALGIGAHVSVPIRLDDGAVFGTLCSFSFRADHTLNERDLALMRVLADIAGRLVQQDIDGFVGGREKRQRIERLLEADELAMVWQPIVQSATGRIVGVEALARFLPEPYRAPPDWFAEAAGVGLGAELEALAVRKALQALQHLPTQCYVACNISAPALLETGAVALFEGWPLERIVLEITEHDVIEDYAPLAQMLLPMRRQGLRLAVDDAGAGYASFRHILRLEPDLIKLDMSLTRDINVDVARRSLALSLVRFSKELGCALIAEGVESQGELDTLVELGVPMAQGFFLHRPQPIEQLKLLLSAVPS